MIGNLFSFLRQRIILFATHLRSLLFPDYAQQNGNRDMAELVSANLATHTVPCCGKTKGECESCIKRPVKRKRKGIYFEDAPMIVEDTSYFSALCALGMEGSLCADNSFESIDISADSSNSAESGPTSISCYSSYEASTGECDTSNCTEDLLPFSLRSLSVDYTPSWMQEADAEWKQEVVQGMNAFRATSIDDANDTFSTILCSEDSQSDRCKELNEHQIDDIHRWRHEFDNMPSCSPDPDYVATRHFHFP